MYRSWAAVRPERPRADRRGCRMDLARLAGRFERSRWMRGWLRDSGIVVFTQGGALVMTTALAVIVARSLGAAEYGIFAGFLGISIAASRCVDVGLSIWLLRELSRVVVGEALADQRAT